MATRLTESLANCDENNRLHVELLHPKHRQLFANLILKWKQSGIRVWIFSSLRGIAEQQALYNQWKSNPKKHAPAAKPGRSLHNFGLAIDVKSYNPSTGVFSKDKTRYIQMSSLASSLGIRWLGQRMGQENHHFDYNVYRIADLIELRKRNRVDSGGYVNLDEIGIHKPSEQVAVNENYSTEIGADVVYYDETVTIEEPVYEKKFNSTVEKFTANGIWQIVKFAADQYSLSQTVNDATFNSAQGSLYSFIQNVIQEPWLQFFGDTIDNKYYFFARKEPFDYNGMSTLPITHKIVAQDVFHDDLSWYDGQIFSWYQIIPKGAFLGGQDTIFAYISAVFFEEYADIWGSRPNIQVSNYINFGNNSIKATLNEKAIEDLRYLVESNMYLPFTRQGEIIMSGRADIKRGYRIIYEPTGEIFYVDSVSHKYSKDEANGADYTTVLKVSRGMKIDYAISPVNADTLSYFNLISFDNQKGGDMTEVGWRVNRKVFNFFLARKQNSVQK